MQQHISLAGESLFELVQQTFPQTCLALKNLDRNGQTDKKQKKPDNPIENTVGDQCCEIGGKSQGHLHQRVHHHIAGKDILIFIAGIVYHQRKVEQSGDDQCYTRTGQSQPMIARHHQDNHHHIIDGVEQQMGLGF